MLLIASKIFFTFFISFVKKSDFGQYLQSATNLLQSHRQVVLPDIFVSSSRRSGSTWLMEGLCSARNIRYIDQLYSWYSASSQQRRVMPLLPYSQYINPSNSVDNHLKRLLKSEILFNT